MKMCLICLAGRQAREMWRRGKLRRSHLIGHSGEHGRMDERGNSRRGRRVSAVMSRRDTERRGFLIPLQADVVDGHFAGFNTINYLLKVFVFEF